MSDKRATMKQHSDTAWNIASKFSHVLASETRDLAALIDEALTAERERCAAAVGQSAQATTQEGE